MVQRQFKNTTNDEAWGLQVDPTDLLFPQNGSHGHSIAVDSACSALCARQPCLLPDCLVSVTNARRDNSSGQFFKSLTRATQNPGGIQTKKVVNCHLLSLNFWRKNATDV